MSNKTEQQSDAIEGLKKLIELGAQHDAIISDEDEIKQLSDLKSAMDLNPEMLKKFPSFASLHQHLGEMVSALKSGNREAVSVNRKKFSEIVAQIVNEFGAKNKVQEGVEQLKTIISSNPLD